ncbi:MAG: hypothetical protein JNK85_22745, partial [Verrucomicrobiales bacterium]|nr:hypothetical protein [Verrucomicrobiales bacterium]
MSAISRRCLGWPRAIIAGIIVLLACGSGGVGTTHAADLPFADHVADRGPISGASGNGTGSNVGASVEPSEPRHGSRPGGRSVWLSWTAPSDGLATFSTTGSSFDTVLAIYAYDRELRG